MKWFSTIILSWFCLTALAQFPPPLQRNNYTTNTQPLVPGSGAITYPTSLIIDGDSKTTTDGASVNMWPKWLTNNPNWFNALAKYHNYAFPGEVFAGISNNVYINNGGFVASGVIQQPPTNNVYIGRIFQNDYLSWSLTDATNNLNSWDAMMLYLHTNGFQVVCFFTLDPGGETTVLQRQVRDYINNRIYLSTNLSYVIDEATFSPVAYAGPIYYDGIHETTNQSKRIANLVDYTFRSGQANLGALTPKTLAGYVSYINGSSPTLANTIIDASGTAGTLILNQLDSSQLKVWFTAGGSTIGVGTWALVLAADHSIMHIDYYNGSFFTPISWSYLDGSTTVLSNLYVGGTISLNSTTGAPPALITTFTGGLWITNQGVAYRVPIY